MHKTEGVSPERYYSEQKLKPLFYDNKIKVNLVTSAREKRMESNRYDKDRAKKEKTIGRILGTKLLTEQAERLPIDKAKMILERLEHRKLQPNQKVNKKLIT